MKYIYLIPQGGFNDCLCQLFIFQQYAIKLNRILLFDFKNSTYNVNFSDYFVLHYNNVIYDNNHIQNIISNKELSVSPLGLSQEHLVSICEGKIKLRAEGAVCFFFNDIPVGFNGNISPESDIVFISQCGGGPLGSNIFKFLDLHHNIKDHILGLFRSIPKPYVAFQIRNTDYKCDYESLLKENINRLKSYKSIFLATDDKQSIDYCKNIGLNIVNFTTFPKENNYTNLHTANIDPHQRMIDLLTDIFIVVGANELISNSNGCFIELLRILRNHQTFIMKKLT